MKKRLKLVLIISSVILLISILCTYSIFFVYGSQIEPESLYVSNVSVTNNIVHIEGDTINSSLGFSGYSTELNGTQLLIKLRYSIVSPFNKYGKFNINYNYTGKAINKIFIIGKDKDNKKLVWSAK